MKKHPLDDLFKARLSNLEKQPASDAWSRIQQGQNTRQKRLSVWIWYVAAGLALALVAGYSVWFSERSALQSEVASHEAPNAPVVQPPKAILVDEKIQKSAHLIAEKPPENNLTGLSSDQPPKVSKVKDENDERVLKKQMEDVPVVSSENATVVVADIDIPEPVSAHQNLTENQRFVGPDTENLNRTIVVNVTDGEDTLKQPKTSRFTRVFRQLKNARAGERVDWEEVGFNPRSVLARVDGKRRQ